MSFLTVASTSRIDHAWLKLASHVQERTRDSRSVRTSQIPHSAGSSVTEATVAAFYVYASLSNSGI